VTQQIKITIIGITDEAVADKVEADHSVFHNMIMGAVAMGIKTLIEEVDDDQAWYEEKYQTTCRENYSGQDKPWIQIPFDTERDQTVLQLLDLAVTYGYIEYRIAND
jgi:hypothetical protein